MQRSRHSLKYLILTVALAVVTAAGATSPLAQAATGDLVSIHHVTRNGATTVLPLINPQPLPPRKIPPCLPCL